MDVNLLNTLTGVGKAANSFANAFAEVSQSNFIAQQFQFNEEIAGIQAEQALAQGVVQQQVLQDKTGLLAGEQTARQAAQGVDVNTGTSQVIREQTAERSGRDYLTLGNNAFLKSLGYKIQGLNDETSAAFAKRSGANKANNLLLGGTEELFQTGLKAIAYDKYPTTPAATSSLPFMEPTPEPNL